MLMHLLACGPYFDEGGAIATLAMFLTVKPLAYFAYIKAFRYRVNRPIPMTHTQAAGLAALRALLGVVLIGGGAIAVAFIGAGRGLIASWVYMYFARLGAWWWIGRSRASLRGRRLVGWVTGGLVINVGFDAATVAGLMAGWTYLACIVTGIALFIVVLEMVSRRDTLKARFSDDPFCRSCQYNLTGNLSGVCPECGTKIEAEEIYV